MSRQFKLRIEVDVTYRSDGTHIAPIVNDALAELVNRYDFKAGTAKGRLVDIRQDFSDVRATVDVSIQHIDPTA